MAPGSVTTASRTEERLGTERYRLFDEVAAGGMASVHLGLQAGDSGFSRVVAIKRLLPDLAREKDFVDMFIDEARLAARIQHPNVVHILDVVREGTQLLLVMEYVSGESLSRLLAQAIRNDEPVPPEIVAAILSGVLHGLHAAHEARDEKQAPLHIVHRDVSPQNVLVGEDGVARVIDFGVAKAVGRLTTTRDGRVKGKAGYMAPEQLRGQPVDRRVDVYAAGVMLWEALVGKRLFVGDSPASTMMLVLEQTVRAPSECAPNVSSSLDAIVLKATSKDPAARFASAEEMAMAIEAAIRPASPPTIAAWVRRVAHEALARRRAMVEAVEGGRGVRAASSPHESRAVTGAETVQATGQPSGASTLATRKSPARWALALLLVPIAVGTWYFARPSAAPSASAPIAASTPITTTTGTSPPSVVASIEPAPSSPPVATTATTTKTALTPHSTQRPPRATVAPPPPDCNPPYVLDAKGIRVPKKECL